MNEFSGLDKIRNSGNDRVSCPSCRNSLEVVANGFFHGDLFFCPEEKKIFGIYLRDITKKAGVDYLKQCERDIALKKTRWKINKDNYLQVIELLTKNKT